jgi:hypothetical protein
MLGDPPDPEAPREVGAFALQPDGRIYTAASRGATVQMYDAAGVLLRAMKPDPGDFGTDHDLRELTVAGDGSVCVAGGGADRHLRFGADGSRAGWEEHTLDDITESWQFLPGTSRRWVVGYQALWLVGEDGKPLREIRRQPDGNWLVHPEELGVAPDGAAAVVAADVSFNSARRLSVYTADGAPVKTIPLGTIGLAAAVAFDGRRAVVSLGKELLLADVSTGAVSTLDLAQPGGARGAKQNAYWKLQFSPGGQELWAMDVQQNSPAIQRYALPNSP